MNIDAPLGHRGCRSATIVVAIALFIGSLPFLVLVGWIVLGSLRISATRDMLLNDIDHVAVRDAGRLLLSQHPKDSWVLASQLPNVLRELDPAIAYIDRQGWLMLQFGGGLHHYGLLISPLSDDDEVRQREHGGQTPLEDGIWYYEDSS